MVLDTSTLYHTDAHGALMILTFCCAVPLLVVYQKFKNDMGAAMMGFFLSIVIIVSWAMMGPITLSVTRRLAEADNARQLYGLDGYDSYDSRHKAVGRATFWIALASLVAGVVLTTMSNMFNSKFINFLSGVQYLTLILIAWLGPVCCYTASLYISDNVDLAKGPGVWLTPSIFATAFVFLHFVFSLFKAKKQEAAPAART